MNGCIVNVNATIDDIVEQNVNILLGIILLDIPLVESPLVHPVTCEKAVVCFHE